MQFNFARDFWTPDHRAVLRRWAVVLKEAYSPPDSFHMFLANEIKRIGGGGNDEGSFRALRNQTSRFIGPDFAKSSIAALEPRKTRNRGMSPDFYNKVLLVFMDARSSAAHSFREVTKKLPEDAGNRLASAFLEFCKMTGISLGGLDWTAKSPREKLRAYAHMQGMVGGTDPIEEMIQNMVKFLDIEKQHADLDRIIFSFANTQKLEAPLVRSFLVFRNTSDPSRVSRMFAQFQSGCADWPWTMFRIFYPTERIESVPPETNGAILGGQQAIYLLGRFGGLEMNTLAVSASSVSQPHFTGLQMGPDGLGSINAARLVFAETDAKNSDSAGIGLVSREEVCDTIGTELARSLRNEVDVFRSDVRRFPGSPEPFSRKALVKAVEAELRSPDGKDVFLRRGDRPFNPADDGQLPFSTAVEMLVRPYPRREAHHSAQVASRSARKGEAS